VIEKIKMNKVEGRLFSKVNYTVLLVRSVLGQQNALQFDRKNGKVNRRFKKKVRELLEEIRETYLIN